MIPRDMLRPVKRDSLADQLIPLMTEEVRNGTWTKAMPGIRVLMKRYQVSRPPVEEALLHLESTGLLGPAKAGKKRLIYPDRDLKQATQIVLVRTHVSKMTYLTRTVYYKMERQLRLFSLTELVIDDQDPSDLAEQFRSSSLTNGLVIGLDIEALVLRQVFPSTKSILMLGGAGLNKDTSTISLDFGRVIVDVVSHLLKVKYREICLIELGHPAGHPGKFGHRIQQAYEQAGKAYQRDRHSPTVERSQVATMIRHVAQLPGIDLILTIRPDVWMRVTGVLQQAGITCLVKCMQGSEMFHLFDEPQALVSIETDDYIKFTLEWIHATQAGNFNTFKRQPRYEVIG